MSYARTFTQSVVLSLLAAIPTAALAGMSVASSPKPKVAFYAVGNPGFLDIEGVTSTVTATDDGTSIFFTVPMSSVSTGIDLRDEHMKDTYLEVGKFPNADLKVPRAAIPWPANVGEAAKGTIKADFTAHGVTKPVDVTYSVRKSKTGFRVEADFKFDAAQHGIAVPSYLGVTVDTKMSAKVTLDLADAG